MRILGDRYHLGEVLGVGGMSVVWRARDEVLGRDVAVKVLSGRYATDPASRQRIRVEARAAAALAHPNIAQVHDFGETVEDGQRTPYIVMELVPGPTLQERAGRAPLPPAEALRICAEVAAGLAAAHADGLVHRDVKPANVILGPTGAKVVDFGIAAAADDPTGADDPVFGTPAYLAPERITNGAVTPASDVYALGVLLYKLLTGRLPWTVTSAADVVDAHLDLPPNPLPELDGVPPEVARLCLRCLAKRSVDRPTAHAVAVALGAAAGPDRRLAAAPRRPGRLVAVGLAGATTAAALAWLLVPAPHQPPAAEAGTSGSRGPAGPVAASAAPPGSAAGTPAGRPGPTTAVSAMDAAVPAIQPLPGEAPPTAGDTTHPPTSAAPAPPQTFTSQGGTVRADCPAAGVAELVAWAPTKPFRVGPVQAGPAAAAVVTFVHGNETIEMTVTCSGGTPAMSTRTSGTG